MSVFSCILLSLFIYRTLFFVVAMKSQILLLHFLIYIFISLKSIAFDMLCFMFYMFKLFFVKFFCPIVLELNRFLLIITSLFSFFKMLSFLLVTSSNFTYTYIGIFTIYPTFISTKDITQRVVMFP